MAIAEIKAGRHFKLAEAAPHKERNSNDFSRKK
jgi:hypothetical protein